MLILFLFIKSVAWFQQDGAAPHNSGIVTNYLNQQFPNKWIGNTSHTLGPATSATNLQIKWPARSPDLTPLDYFYWPHLKNRLYQETPTYNNIEDLRQKIIEISNDISVESINNSIIGYENRLYKCFLNNGMHFEHLKNRLNG